MRKHEVVMWKSHVKKEREEDRGKKERNKGRVRRRRGERREGKYFLVWPYLFQPSQPTLQTGKGMKKASWIFHPSKRVTETN